MKSIVVLSTVFDTFFPTPIFPHELLLIYIRKIDFFVKHRQVENGITYEGQVACRMTSYMYYLLCVMSIYFVF